MLYRFAIVSLIAWSTAAFGQDMSQLRPANSADQYRQLSEAVAAIDKTAWQKELANSGREQPIEAEHTQRFGFDPGQPADFYRTPEGQAIADIVLSYQTPSGGWSKRTDMGKAPRQPGQRYGVEKNYIPTFDNNATSTQFWLLTKAWAATDDKRYSHAATRALHLILLAQYPGGGWPQNFPLTGDYHDNITYNDTVMSNLLTIVGAAARGQLEFVPDTLQAQARDSLARGLAAVVNTQVIVNGEAAIWGAQHDPVTLAPAAARKFEPVALATAESADLLLFLMSLDNPTPAIKNAITRAYHWLEQHQIHGYRWDQKLGDYSELIADPEAGPLWARFYEIGSNKPVFGDRDGSIHYDMSEISIERQHGYGWYTERPAKVLKAFPAWQNAQSP